jgi:hypothetical protein
MRDHSTRSMRHGWKRAFASIIVLLLCSALHAQETCPVEIKLLLVPSTIKSVRASLSFEKQTTSQVYFFDTGNLSLLNQGVILRVRHGAKNDLTVKVRLPEGKNQAVSSKLREHFGCEIDRTEAGANTSYSVGKNYKLQGVPEDGDDLFRALSSRQRELLREARVSIPWSQVRRISEIRSTTWETPLESPFRKLTLEYWEFPGGSLLELSARSAASEWEVKSEDLHRIAKSKGLLLSANQEMKTSTVLRALKHDKSRNARSND